MGKSIDDRGPATRLARRDEGAYPSVCDRRPLEVPDEGGATKPVAVDRSRERLICPFAGP
jgi:hypothetical protein